MNALLIINHARAAGVTISIDGDKLLLRPSAPAPREVIEALSRQKLEVIDFLQSDRCGWSVERWQAFFDKRAASSKFDSVLSRREAEARAFAPCIVKWLNRNPIRSAQDDCCWCGGAERAADILLFFGVAPTGHAWLHSGCWQPWREGRRAQAVDFLHALGIAAPSESSNDFAKNGGK